MIEILADESCDRAVVTALRGAGFGVEAIAEFGPGACDADVAALVEAADLVLLTEDALCGKQVFQTTGRPVGVVEVRSSGYPRGAVGAAVVRAVTKFQGSLRGRYATVRPGFVRLSEPTAAR